MKYLIKKSKYFRQEVPCGKQSSCSTAVQPGVEPEAAAPTEPPSPLQVAQAWPQARSRGNGGNPTYPWYHGLITLQEYPPNCVSPANCSARSNSGLLRHCYRLCVMNPIRDQRTQREMEFGNFSPVRSWPVMGRIFFLSLPPLISY